MSRNRIVKILFGHKIGMFLFFMIIAFQSLLFAEEVAYISKCKGTVQAKIIGSKKWHTVKRGDAVHNNTLMLAGDNSEAEIKFIDGKSSIKLLRKSALSINAEGIVVFLTKTLLLKTGKLSCSVKNEESGTFKVVTNTSRLEARYSEFRVSEGKINGTTALCLEGSVKLINTKLQDWVNVTSGRFAISNSRELSDNKIKKSTFDKIKKASKLPSQGDKKIIITFKNENGEERKVELLLRGQL